jgi:hypothetical protein
VVVVDIVGAHLVGDGAHPLEVPQARIGAGAADDHLGLFCDGGSFHLVVIDGLGVFADVVKGGVVELAAEAELVAVGQVAAMRKVEAEDGVAGLDDGAVSRGVGLGAGVRLHVGIFGAKKLLGAITGEVFDHVGELAATVVAATGVAFGVLVGKDGAGRFKNGLRHEVFAGDHLQAFVLAESLMVEGCGYLRVFLG